MEEIFDWLILYYAYACFSLYVVVDTPSLPFEASFVLLFICFVFILGGGRSFVYFRGTRRFN